MAFLFQFQFLLTAVESEKTKINMKTKKGNSSLKKHQISITNKIKKLNKIVLFVDFGIGKQK